MLHSLSLMTGASILATDGVIGSVSDFFFDDATWIVRFLVVQTGNWLAHREVLIATTAVDPPDWDRQVFPVHLTKEQVRHAPDVETKKPVSRQQEIAMSRYFGCSEISPQHECGLGGGTAVQLHRRRCDYEAGREQRQEVPVMMTRFSLQETDRRQRPAFARGACRS